MSEKKVDIAQQVSFTCYDRSVIIRDIDNLGKKLNNVLVVKGEILKFDHKGDTIELVVLNHTPEPGVVMITDATRLFLQYGDYKTRLESLKALFIQRC